MVKKAKPVPGTDAVLMASNIKGDVRIHYKDQSDFERIAHQFGVFKEWKVNYSCDIWEIFFSFFVVKVLGVFGDDTRESPALYYIWFMQLILDF